MDPESTEGYVRLEEAARVAKVSEKTVRNWAEAKKIGRKKVKGVVYYNLSDLEEQGAKAAETRLIRDNPYAGAVLPQIAATVAGAMQRMNPPAEEALPVMAVPLEKKLWLTLGEAVAYTGLGQAYIRQHAEGRRIGPHGSLVFRRQHLDRMG